MGKDKQPPPKDPAPNPYEKPQARMKKRADDSKPRGRPTRGSTDKRS